MGEVRERAQSPGARRLAGIVRAVVGFVVPPGGSPWLLTVRTLTYAVGSGAYLAVNAVFFTRYAGLSAAEVALGLSVRAAVELLVSVSLGRVADRVGGLRAWLAGSLAQALLFALYPQVRDVSAFLAVIVLMGCAGSLGAAGRARYIGDVVAAGRRVGVSAFLRSVQNIGLAAGTGLAGLALAVDTPSGYVLVIYLNSGILLLEVLLLACFGATAGSPAAAGPARFSRTTAMRDVPFLALSALNGLLALNEPMLFVVLPLWILQRTDAPQVLIAVTLVVNMAMTVLLQVRTSRRAEDVIGAARSQRFAGCWLAAACLTFWASGLSSGPWTVALLVGGLVTLTFGELYASAAAWGQSYGLAPDGMRAEYIAVHELGPKATWILGPLGVVALVMTPAGWLVMVVLFLAVAALCVPAARWAMSTPRPGAGTRTD
ncbi:MFS transporter [Nonomuraea zeae]|uniref:MFS transporter n=1 Tax=Nonomuraea zeae TaxID=1642303 RepID=UPI00147829E6|nr:MFS transporter [Nonomuraea zeae]